MTCSGTSRSGAITSRSSSTSFEAGGAKAAPDLVLLALVAGLVVFGLLMLYSASFIYAQERTGDGLAFLKKQLLFVMIGAGALAAGLRIDYRRWSKLAYPALAAGVVLLALTYLPGVGVKVGGAQRWLRLGPVGFQPGELAKLALIVFTAGQLARKAARIRVFAAGTLSSLALSAPLLCLLLLQPDFGSASIGLLVLFLMLFLAGVPVAHLLAVVAAAAVAGAALVVTSPYRLARLTAFMDPWADPLGKGFQILQSLLGVHNGGFWGLGLGNGREKLFYLPEAHNDFIFAVIGEELGFLGVFGVAAAFAFFLYRGLRISRHCATERGDLFGSLLAAGITLCVTIQGYVNMAVVMGLLPTKGLPLPFISYGGSAMVANLFAVGVLLSISKGPAAARRKNG